jgi:hypothetical protein
MMDPLKDPKIDADHLASRRTEQCLFGWQRSRVDVGREAVLPLGATIVVALF